MIALFSLSSHCRKIAAERATCCGFRPTSFSRTAMPSPHISSPKISSPNIPSYFDRYGWAFEILDLQTWRASFFGDQGEEFDLYVMLSDEWVHFAVSPFLPDIQDLCRPRLYEAMLRVNQEARLVYFALDEDGDANLLVELARHRFAYRHFELALNALTEAARYLSVEMRRLASEPDYRSSMLNLKL
jgi:hypothetical protein